MMVSNNLSTPRVYPVDRFIPSRRIERPDVRSDQIIRGAQSAFTPPHLAAAAAAAREATASSSPDTIESRRAKHATPSYEELLSQALFNVHLSTLQNTPILNSSTIPRPPQREWQRPFDFQAPLPVARRRRVISPMPVRILDAQGMADDFYSQNLVWSSSNKIAVVLRNAVYIWNPETSQSLKLFQEDARDVSPNVSPFSVCWLRNQQLVVGKNNGIVELWDETCEHPLHTWGAMHGHCFSHPGYPTMEPFEEGGVFVGNKSNTLFGLDFRMRKAMTMRKKILDNRTTDEVCGIKLSPNSTSLAVSGNDQSLKIWDCRLLSGSRAGTGSGPINQFSDHRASVRALTWLPWNPSLLLTGAGTADRCIRLFDIQRNQLLDTVDTGSQVCTLRASPNGQEIISTHGYSDNVIRRWEYKQIPSRPTERLHPREQLTGHTKRVLHSALSPDGTTIVTGSADETLQFWEIFKIPKRTSSLETFVNGHLTIR